MQLIFLCLSKMPKESHAQINFIIGSQKAITSANINAKQDNLQVIGGKAFCAQHYRAGVQRQKLAEERRQQTL